MAESQRDQEERDLQLPPLQTWTQEQRDYWETYVCDLADALRLGHVEMYFEWGKSLDKDIAAASNSQLKRNRLRLAWSENLPNDPVEEARDSAVHELMHYHTAKLRQSILCVEDHVQKDVFLAIAKMIDLEEEQLVDAVTRLLAPTLPLPVWPVKS